MRLVRVLISLSRLYHLHNIRSFLCSKLFADGGLAHVDGGSALVRDDTIIPKSVLFHYLIPQSIRPQYTSPVVLLANWTCLKEHDIPGSCKKEIWLVNQTSSIVLPIVLLYDYICSKSIRQSSSFTALKFHIRDILNVDL